MRNLIRRISDTIWELPVGSKKSMRVPARIYATERLLRDMEESVFDQVANVATLPGIARYAFCMPDGHSGYGFPIGGVAAMDLAQGAVISPGGIGFDINCGMRLLLTNLSYDEVKPSLKKLVDNLFSRVPTGVGCTGIASISRPEFRRVIEKGARWCIDHGYGWSEDLELTEERGCVAGADSSAVSEKAIDRGLNQLGTLGSGNHYLEVQIVKPEHVFDRALAGAFGITIPNQVAVMFHCGSRGFGHQVATDYLQRFLKVMGPKYGIATPDRELACAPFDSPDGQAYFAAMNCGINMSFANRQMILHRVREAFSETFGRSAEDLGMHMVYDVSHNTAKLERHQIDGKTRSYLVHRKGATRAFAPASPDLPPRYREIGQPVIIGGSMETGSYLLTGTGSGSQTFFSTAHGAGRTMSRTKARRLWKGQSLKRDLEARGIYVRTASLSGLAEEAGAAYKDIDAVIDATERSGLSRAVVRFVPIGNVKG
jgi:tRNA-splicing ligase RtcB (3'-phosphate/5'-hydroxy nucleic acid ligase)